MLLFLDSLVKFSVAVKLVPENEKSHEVVILIKKNNGQWSVETKEILNPKQQYKMLHLKGAAFQYVAILIPIFKGIANKLLLNCDQSAKSTNRLYYANL